MTMFVQSFPPADAMIQQLIKIDYKKLFDQFLTVILTIAAISYVIAEKFVQWYRNGGKDATIQLLIKVRNFLQVCYTWIVSEGYPELKKFVDNVKQTYDAWTGLVTIG